MNEMNEMNEAVEQIWKNLLALPQEEQLGFYATLFGSLQVRDPRLLIENAVRYSVFKGKLTEGVDISI